MLYLGGIVYEKKKKLIVGGIIGIIVVVIVLLVFIYLNLFKNNSSSRFKNASKYALSNNEINSVKQEIKDIENVDKVSIEAKNKIISINIKLKEDIDFDDLSTVLNNTINNFKEKNLKYYDIEVFVESKNEESEVYPKIGYKHKTSSEFIW